METANRPTGMRRSVLDRVVAGVAGGIADHFSVDVAWIRLGFVLTAAVWGAGLLAYAVLWITLPEATTSDEDEVRPPLATDQPQAVLGVLLLCAGLVLVIWKLLSWISFAAVFPILLIALGLFLLKRRIA